MPEVRAKVLSAKRVHISCAHSGWVESHVLTQYVGIAVVVVAREASKRLSSGQTSPGRRVTNLLYQP
jgi:hypothetical protein